MKELFRTAFFVNVYRSIKDSKSHITILYDVFQTVLVWIVFAVLCGLVMV